jgi:hypothetical protein
VDVSAPLHFVLKSVKTSIRREPQNDRMTLKDARGILSEVSPFRISRMPSSTGKILAVWRFE